MRTKRSITDQNDNTDVYEVYGNNGFLGFAHLETNVATPVADNDDAMEEESDDNEPILVELNHEDSIYKDIHKRSRYGDDFIRLSRSNVYMPPPTAGKRSGGMWKLRGGKRFSSGNGLRKRGGTFIRLSRSSLDEPLEEPHKRIMWKFRAGKRSSHLSSGDMWYYFRARK